MEKKPSSCDRDQVGKEESAASKNGRCPSNKGNLSAVPGSCGGAACKGGCRPETAAAAATRDESLATARPATHNSHDQSPGTTINNKGLSARKRRASGNTSGSSSAGGGGGKVRRMKIKVCPATGGQVEVCVYPYETVRGLKQILARKYSLHPGRINLLHRNRVLKDGSLQDNEITDGSHLFLCPNMESGKSPASAEQSVVQALRNLSDAQIHDFLAGRSHLRLAIRLNEHLLIVQLQLSAPAVSRETSVSPVTRSPATDAAACLPTPPPSPTEKQCFDVPSISPVSLLQASRNLSDKIKELSHLSRTQQEERQSTLLTPPPSPPPSPGAVIETMQHRGKGVYSGTFSGMLDPRLQDRSGQPRRDINTIMHILHDLLNAQPVSAMSGTSGSNAATTTSATQSAQALKPPSPPPRDGEAAVLRDKVQHVQHMLECRRQRRAARRLSQRPYRSAPPTHSPSRHIPASSAAPVSPSSSVFLPEKMSATNSNSATATSTHGNAAAAASSSHAENAETSNYRKPSMEQETVAV